MLPTYRAAPSARSAWLHRLCAGVRIGLVLVGFAHQAPAQTPDASPPPQDQMTSLQLARALFAEAAELEAREQWVEASTKLRAVLAIRETPGVRFHLAYCLENHGELVAALESYRRAAELNEAAPAADVSALLKPAIERTSLRVPRMTVEVEAADARVMVDGRSMPPNEPLVLDPGPHLVEVSAPGFIAARRKVTLREAERRRFALVLDALPPPPEPEPDSLAADPEHSSRGVAVLATGGLTLAAAGAGVALTIARTRAAHRVADGRSALQQQGLSTADCVEPRTVTVERACWQVAVYGVDADRARAGQIISLVAAGGGSAAFVATYLRRRGARRSANPDQLRVRSTRVAVGGLPGRSGTVMLSGRF